MNFFQHIIRSGLHRTDEYQNRRGIMLTNYISIILIVALLLLYINRLVRFHDNMVDTLSIGLIVFTAPIIFNRFYYTLLSRLLLCYVPVCFTWYVFITRMQAMNGIDQTVYDGLRIFLLAFCFIPYLLFDRSKLTVLFIGIMPTLISFLFFSPILEWVGLLEVPVGNFSEDYQLMPIRALSAYTVISLGCFVFQSIIHQNDNFNKKLLAELKNRTEEIETQNELLVQSQARLNEINQHLEQMVDEKTKSIQKKNEMLVNYAYTNAHKVRGPVARILGLIQLSKIKTDLDYPWFFDKVEQETHQIDEIINRISEELDEANLDKP